MDRHDDPQSAIAASDAAASPRAADAGADVPDAVRVVVWDVPAVIERGRRFTLKIGVTRSTARGIDGWRVEVRDHEGVSRAAATVGPDGLYPQGPVRCEFLLYCDGSVGCVPCAGEDAPPPVALANWAHWHHALAALGITPPWTRDEFADFYEWLAAMIEETELGYSDDAMYLPSESTPAIEYELPRSPEPHC